MQMRSYIQRMKEMTAIRVLLVVLLLPGRVLPARGVARAECVEVESDLVAATSLSVGVAVAMVMV